MIVNRCAVAETLAAGVVDAIVLKIKGFQWNVEVFNCNSWFWFQVWSCSQPSSKAPFCSCTGGFSLIIFAFFCQNRLWLVRSDCGIAKTAQDLRWQLSSLLGDAEEVGCSKYLNFQWDWGSSHASLHFLCVDKTCQLIEWLVALKHHALYC